MEFFLAGAFALSALFGAGGFALGKSSSPNQPASPETSQRGYDAARSGRDFGDWLLSGGSPNSDLRGGEATIRHRARDLEKNSDMVRGALRARRTNIFGQSGIRLQAQLREGGRPDKERNAALEKTWADWCRADSCDVTGQHNFNQLMALADRRAFVDGAVLIRLIKQRVGRSPVGFALQLLEIDQLDETRNRIEPTGNHTVMGVEVNKWGRPVAYHLRNYYPQDILYRPTNFKTERIPANEIIFWFRPERPGQTRDASKLASVIALVRHSYKYQEAELISSRGGANYAGVITTPEADEDRDEQGRPVEYLEPGTIKRLLPGEEFVGFTPNRPNSALAEFFRHLKRSFAVAVGISYESSSGDFSQASFASLRQSLLAERDNWRVEQADAIEYQQRIWEYWVNRALAANAIDPLHYLDHEPEYLHPRWLCRGWAWVDPLKDAKAVIELIKSGLFSRTRALGEQGLDFEEVCLELAAEKEMAENLGLNLALDGGGNLQIVEGEANG